MNFAIVENGQTVNIIVAEPDVAEALGALPIYEDCAIGEPYQAPHVHTDLELAQQDITDRDIAGIELGQAVTDLELSDIAQGQAATDLELMILGGV